MRNLVFLFAFVLLFGCITPTESIPDKTPTPDGEIPEPLSYVACDIPIYPDSELDIINHGPNILQATYTTDASEDDIMEFYDLYISSNFVSDEDWFQPGSAWKKEYHSTDFSLGEDYGSDVHVGCSATILVEYGAHIAGEPEGNFTTIGIVVMDFTS